MARPLFMLFGAISLVVLVACANVTNLMLSRAAAREREFAVLVSIGASQRRLFQMLLAEALVLTLAAGGAAVLIARWVLDAVPKILSDRVPGLEDVPIDYRVVLFILAVSLGTAILISAIPFFAIARRGRSDALRETGDRATPGSRGRMIQDGLVVLTVAVALVLSVAAGLLIRSFTSLAAIDRGFRLDEILTVSVSLPREAYPTGSTVRAFQQSLLDRASTLPGVRSAALASTLPFEEGLFVMTPEGANATPVNQRMVQGSQVQGAYFETFGIPLKRGRYFSDDEYRENRRVAIVSEKLANRFWPGQDPIGRRLKRGTDSYLPWLTIVGVVGDVVAGGRIAAATLGDDSPMYVYEPLRQTADAVFERTPFGRTLSLVLSSRQDPRELAGLLRKEISRLDAQLALTRVDLMSERLRDVLAPQRFAALLLGTFAVGALLLASAGLYAMLTLTVARRSREMGVRLALGAKPAALVLMVMRQAAWLVGLGLAAGIVLAALGARLMRSLLYGVAHDDLATFTVVPLVLLGIAVLAAGLPAIRASRLDPLSALRDQ